LIQIGFTLSDKNGDLVHKNSVWQFNFEFNLSEEPHNTDSINLLKNSGIDFARLHQAGIPHERFAECMMASGLICNPKFAWIVFHGGYDFGYLLRLLSGENLPVSVSDFYSKLACFFPRIQDIKIITAEVGALKGGLNRMADALQVKRTGTKHQAGSDSLQTIKVFQRL
jgi:CCR4-NOT transcription complex subunit 7/8